MTADLRIGPAEWEAALDQTDGPQIVVAGPGTGKTEFLVRRATRLIESQRAQPGQVLMLSFSRRTAADLERRAGANGQPLPVIATFHSFARRLLEAHSVPGPVQLPAILTSPEQVSLVRELLVTENAEDWPLALGGLLTSATLAEEVADFLLRCQERLLDPEKLAVLAQTRPRWSALPQFMRRYLAELEARARLDYASLLTQATRLLDDSELRSRTAEQFPYVLVDEYQDTSPAQARLLELLTSDLRNLTVTGDPYQSIYSFRGADLRNIEEFTHRFSDLHGKPARRIVLTESFRVPAEILEGALRIVSSGALPGSAGPVTPAPHRGRVEVYVFDQASGEADWISREVERLHLEERVPYRRIGVLVRSTRHLLPELSRALSRRKIPHRPPDRRLTDHPAVRVVFDLALAARADLLARDPAGSPGWVDEADRAVRRLLLGPLIAIGLGQERDLLRTRRRTRRPWHEILADESVGSPGLHDLLSRVDWCQEQPAAQGFWEAWTAVAEFERIACAPEFADERRALTEFAQVLDQQAERDRAIDLLSYERLASREDFEAVPLLALQATRGDELILTTLHQAKGIEFDVVIISDAAEGVFPSLQRSHALLRPELLGGDGDYASAFRFRLQEEMRLAYTAMTRARSRVVWTATSAAIDEGERRPSRFLLSAIGADSFEEVSGPAEPTKPVTWSEAMAHLRLTIADPAAAASARLAALETLIARSPDALRFAGVAEPGPDHGVVLAPLRMSPTSAEAYATCPRRYVLEGHLDATEGSSVYAHYGTLIHAVMEGTEREAIARGDTHGTIDSALGHIDRVWNDLADFGSPVLNAAWKRKGEALLTQLYANWPGADAVGVRAEVKVQTDIGPVVWAGRIDRVESQAPGELRIVDYKTGTNAPSVKEAAESLQLGFYLLAAQTDPELSELGKATEAQLWYPEANGAVRSFSLENLAQVVATLGEVAGSILAEDWAPRPGPHCERCTVRLVCPAWPEGRESYRV